MLCLYLETWKNQSIQKVDGKVLRMKSYRFEEREMALFPCIRCRRRPSECLTLIWDIYIWRCRRRRGGVDAKAIEGRTRERAELWLPFDRKGFTNQLIQSSWRWAVSWRFRMEWWNNDKPNMGIWQWREVECLSYENNKRNDEGPVLEKKRKREWTNALCTAERAKKEKTDRSLSCTCLPERIEWKRGKGKEKLTGPERD